MKTIGLRELRQNASEILRHVEAGEEVVVTVAGRPSARLIRATSRNWRTWGDISGLFAGPADPDWETDRAAIAHDLRDPWETVA